MQTFLVILKDKRQSELTYDLLTKHINHLKTLAAKDYLVMCGPFKDNSGAILIIRAGSSTMVEKLIQVDPFIVENYYQSYSITEFIEANKTNQWLMNAKQTADNLAK